MIISTTSYPVSCRSTGKKGYIYFLLSQILKLHNPKLSFDQFEDQSLLFRILKISGRLSLFPYWIINQPTKEKYATRKQARFRWIKNLAVKYLRTQGISGCRILKTVMVINEVKKPVTSPANISHLQNIALSLLEYQDSNIFVHL